jgi:hypothetical protein
LERGGPSKMIRGKYRTPRVSVSLTTMAILASQIDGNSRETRAPPKMVMVWMMAILDRSLARQAFPADFPPKMVIHRERQGQSNMSLKIMIILGEILLVVPVRTRSGDRRRWAMARTAGRLNRLSLRRLQAPVFFAAEKKVVRFLVRLLATLEAIAALIIPVISGAVKLGALSTRPMGKSIRLPRMLNLLLAPPRKVILNALRPPNSLPLRKLAVLGRTLVK